MTLVDVLERAFPKTIHSFTPLTEALAKLEILPFSAESVTFYKHEAREKLAKRLVPIAALLGGAGEYMPSIRRQVERLGFNPTETSFRYFFDSQTSSYPQYVAVTWKRRSTSLETATTDMVPEFVQHKMKQVADEVPGVTFAVDELVSHKDVFDPFLVAICGKEEFYIEVWGTDDLDFNR